MDLTVGTRVSIAEYICTIKYVGNVDNTQGIWLGVEWDDPARGKHNGTKDGKQYFECRCVSFYNCQEFKDIDLIEFPKDPKCRILHSSIGFD